MGPLVTHSRASQTTADRGRVPARVARRATPLSSRAASLRYDRARVRYLAAARPTEATAHTRAHPRPVDAHFVQCNLHGGRTRGPGRSPTRGHNAEHRGKRRRPIFSSTRGELSKAAAVKTNAPKTTKTVLVFSWPCVLWLHSNEQPGLCVSNTLYGCGSTVR
jgi:hypothetical protein